MVGAGLRSPIITAVEMPTSMARTILNVNSSSTQVGDVIRKSP